MARTRTISCMLTAAAVLAGLSACSSSGHQGAPAGAAESGAGAGGTSTSTTGAGTNQASSPVSAPASSPVPSQTMTPVATAPGKAVLATIVLSAADLPSGWTGAAYKGDPNTARVNTQMAHCAGYRDTQPDQVALAHGDTFTLGNATVDSEAISYKSNTDIVADREAATKPKFKACYDAGLRAAVGKSLPAGASIKRVSTQLTQDPAGSPIAGTISTVLTIATSSGQVSVYSVDMLATGRLTQVQLDMSSLGKPVSTALRSRLINLLDKRVSQY